MNPLDYESSTRMLISKMMGDMERIRNDRESRQAKADPQAHKLSRVIEGGTNYRYWQAGKDGRGHTVRFCWSSHRNVAGYFLGWREVESKKQTKRDMWTARKVLTRVQEIAKRRADAWKKRHETAVAP